MTTDAAVATPAETVVTPTDAAASAEAAKASASTDAPKGTAAEGTKVQPDGDAAPGGDGDGAKAAPYESVVSAQRKADAMEMAEAYDLEGDFATVTDVKTALAERAEAERDAARDTSNKSYYSDLARTMNDALASLVIEVEDALGNKVSGKLTPDQIQSAVFNHLNDFRSTVRRDEQTAHYQDLADAAVTLIGDEAAVTAWGEEVRGKNLPFDKWLASVVEHAAPTSKAWKKLEREHKIAIEKHGLEKWEEGNKAPPGQATQAGGRGITSPSIVGKSPKQIAEMITAGEVDTGKELALVTGR